MAGSTPPVVVLLLSVALPPPTEPVAPAPSVESDVSDRTGGPVVPQAVGKTIAAPAIMTQVDICIRLIVHLVKVGAVP